ncbi:hypothetical protein [Arthrobacter sp. D3-16]
METLKKIVSNQYFPAAAVLTAVVLFWAVGLLGGLSLLHNNQPPLTTLTWILFVYGAAVLTPLAGALAAVDLVRRWKRNRAAEAAYAAQEAYAGEESYAVDEAYAVEEAQPAEAARAEPITGQQAAPAAPRPAQPAAPAAPKKDAKQAGRKQAA